MDFRENFEDFYSSISKKSAENQFPKHTLAENKGNRSDCKERTRILTSSEKLDSSNKSHDYSQRSDSKGKEKESNSFKIITIPFNGQSKDLEKCEEEADLDVKKSEKKITRRV